MSDATTTTSSATQRAFTVAVGGYLLAWAATFVFVAQTFGMGPAIGASLAIAIPFGAAVLMLMRWHTVQESHFAMLLGAVVLVWVSVIALVGRWYDIERDRHHAMEVEGSQFVRHLHADPAFAKVQLQVTPEHAYIMSGKVASNADLDRLLATADQYLTTWWWDEVAVGGTSRRPAIADKVPRWQPHVCSFEGPKDAANPFQVDFSATVRGPGGKEFKLPGFFDGKGTWKVRVSPTAEGRWSLITASDVPELNKHRVDFTCVRQQDPRMHGLLRVDGSHPHHFVFDDGTRFFLQGYECDWLWALDSDRFDIPTVNDFLDYLLSHGFNYLILNSYAYDTDWRKGKTGPDDYGPSPLCAWEGINAEPDHSRMNLDYWQHYDQVIEALYLHGMQAHMLMKVYNKHVRWPVRGSSEEDQFFRWLIARYAAYPNVVWDFSKEAHLEKDLAYKQARLTFMRENDPYHHLLTVHDDDKANDAGAYDELTDFRADQQHSDWHATILRQRARRDWPVVNVEFGYEHGPGGMDDKTYKVVQSPEEVVRRAWEIAMAGGYTAYYYTYTAWDVIRPGDRPPGCVYFEYFGDFFRETEYWLLGPADELVSEGWCLANPRREYVVFLDHAKPVSLKVASAPSPLRAQWFNPHTGQHHGAGEISNGTVQFRPPANWGIAPVVLHLRAK